MLRKNFLRVLVLAVIVLLWLGPSTDEGSRATSIPDTVEAKAIMAVMEQAYQLMHGTSIPTFDVNRFAEVFIDAADVQLSTEWQEYVSEMRGSAVTENVGYLTAMQTKWKHFQEGDRLARAALVKAQAENRDLTTEEWQELAKQNHGVQPPIFDEADPMYKPNLRYDAIEIDQDKATVRYDAGQALQEAILRLVNGRWFIADIRAIQVHF